MEWSPPSQVVLEFSAQPGQDVAALIRQFTPSGYKFKTMDRKGSVIRAVCVPVPRKPQPEVTTAA